MNEPLLSVIVPIYNVEDYIERCLDSILNQTYRNLEIICISDGNKDKSNSIVKEKYLSDSRVRFIEKENGGLVSVRKRGIKEASGDYITHVDGDDWIEENMYSELMELMCKYDADMVTSGEIRDYGSYIVEANEDARADIYYGDKLNNLKKRLVRTDVFYKSMLSVHQWNKIYKKELVSKIQYETDERCSYGEDAVVVYPAIFASDKIIISGKNYYHYCLRKDSMGGVFEDNTKEQISALRYNMRRAFVKYGGDLPNILEQANTVLLYLSLLRDVRNEVKYDGRKLYPFGEIAEGEKLAIYGAGKFGKVLKELLVDEYGWNNVDWIDSTGANGAQKIDSVDVCSYDKILLAILAYDVAEKATENLLNKGAIPEKILRVNIAPEGGK